MRSLSHAVGVITDLVKRSDVRLFDGPVTFVTYHHEDTPMVVMFKPKCHIMVQVVHVVNMDESVLKHLLADALASVYCHKHFEVMKEAHRTALVPSKVEVPVLHPFESPRWNWWRSKVMEICSELPDSAKEG